MSLESRVKAFDVLSGRFPCERPSRLISVHKIRSHLWEKLRLCAAIYMSKFLPGGQVILEEKELLNAYVMNQKNISNITPNGMIVPKRNSILEYNNLVRAYADIIGSLEIQDLIVSWHVPLNLRIKFSSPNAENLTRHHPTEDIHSDSWAGESSESVTTQLPIFGDTDNNFVKFYDPPKHFQEDWLQPLATYAAGASIAAQYAEIKDHYYKKGYIALADFTTLHSSSRKTGAEARVSIDTTFALKKELAPGEKETIHPWREGERMSPEALAGVGETHLFVFPDRLDQQVDSAGGFRHPTNLKVLKILD